MRSGGVVVPRRRLRDARRWRELAALWRAHADKLEKLGVSAEEAAKVRHAAELVDGRRR